jgi:hypothetical protein
MNDRNEHGTMSQELDPRADSGQPMVYQVRITGQLDSRWADWFEGLAITLDGGDTLITGPVVDQAALLGLLKRVRDLGLPLVSVTPMDDGRHDAAPPAPRCATDARGGGTSSKPPNRT